jgi:hypothetical protein
MVRMSRPFRGVDEVRTARLMTDRVQEQPHARDAARHRRMPARVVREIHSSLVTWPFGAGLTVSWLVS